MMRFLAVSLFSVLTSLAFSAPPNIVFILVDDMGYADLGCMGSKDIQTPNIDRIAANGIKFEQFYANAPVCTPTRCGFITGRWQQRVGFEFAMGYQAEQVRLVDGMPVPEPDIHGLGLPSDQPSIARFLKSGRYATGIFGKWHLGYKDEYSPLHFGFDEYFGTLLGHTDYYRHLYMDGTNPLRDGLKKAEKEGYLTDLINERAAAFITAHRKDPFFLYVPHQAVHAPFQEPDHDPQKLVTKETMHDGSRKAYKAMLERVDAGVGMIYNALEKAGVVEDTLIVLSSDNGGERWSDNRPLFHHKATLWEGGIRVPCLMSWPTTLPKGKVSRQVAITMDLTATFLAAAKVSLPADYKADGINLIPILTGSQPEVERTFFWRINRNNRKQWAIRHGKWKYLNDGNTMELLYDLEADVTERRSLYSEHPEIAHDLKTKLAAWEQEMDASPRTFIVK
ncbi:MAG: sulfatase-like hydrolase/transferase [Verrucomicrobiaceae bacterium]|nr:sulfatase-like hydrolase/transferase [Verrucomicrobiaceae bacterium]